MSRSTTTLHRPSRSQRGWVWLCVVSLLAFQALGLVHRALHGGGLPTQLRLAVQMQSWRTAVGLHPALTSLASPALRDGSNPATLGWEALASAFALTPDGASGDTVAAAPVAGSVVAAASPAGPAPRFGHAAGSIDCQLLDQLGQALGPIVQALAWTALLPDGPVATPQPHSAPLARVWRLPARAPPLA